VKEEKGPPPLPLELELCPSQASRYFPVPFVESSFFENLSTNDHKSTMAVPGIRFLRAITNDGHVGWR
jgi:hypothetical protein